MKIQARKCPFTGKIFTEDKIGAYIWHLKETRDKMRAERKSKRIKDSFWNWLREEKLKLTHPDMIPQWLLDNQQTIMDAYTAGCRPKYTRAFEHDKFVKGDIFTKISWERSPVFSDVTSNSHSCPDDGEENWCSRDSSIPGGYPGWSGHVNGSLKRPPKKDYSYPYGQFLNLVGIKTGSGGGGNENWSYDFKLFLSDWPGLQVEYKEILRLRREVEADRIIGRLKGKWV